MLARADLERQSGTLTDGNVGHAQTLYLQDIVLSTVSRETADELVFKGGTALHKFYQLDRFSEDLDFTAREPIDIDTLIRNVERDLENYGASVADRTVDESGSTTSARLGIQGPLYTGDRRSLCFIRLEVNSDSSAQHESTRRYISPFTDIPAFELVLLDEAEILAEKIRALLTRAQPRDLYDCYHLFEQAVVPKPGLIQAKLDLYDITYDATAVLEAAEELEPTWEQLHTLTYSEPPPFTDVIGVLEAHLPPTGDGE